MAGDSTQVTLRLTIENSEEDSDFLRVRALVLGDTPKVLEQPEGEGLYFDKTTYSIRVRERGTAHEVRTDTPVDIWRVQMLAAGARVPHWEYTYEEAIELYNSITTEMCRHQAILSPSLAEVWTRMAVTVGGYSFAYRSPAQDV
ncbi:hypothetical protein GH714_043027 [Hevea brasiliensis]|uniref:Uncharacterized protein n=1 Tax=Hevea brasiliensis TaxID=3981 RepID=A0A6A6K1K5_HEVBR|nr:hypothetical protein GH714_043027 [Hevea brasiliensis]